jgi:hypothetical protein
MFLISPPRADGQIPFLERYDFIPTKCDAKNISHVYLELTLVRTNENNFLSSAVDFRKDIGFGRIPGFVCSGKSDI